MSGLPKSVRLHHLVQILSSRKHYLTAPDLAKTLGVTERTVHRDLVALNLLGYSIYSDRGYKLHNPESKALVPFSGLDLSTLKVLIEASPLSKLPHMRERCQILLAKLKLASLQSEADSNLDQSIEPFEPDFPAHCSIDVDQLEKAIHRRRKVSILYHSLDEPSPTHRLLDPYVITLRSGNWYLVAFNPEKNDFHLYRLERILTLTPTQEPFERDPTFDLQKFFRQSMTVYRGEPIPIKLRLKGKAARLAAERPWPEGMTLDWESEDTAILQVTVQGTHEILAWTLSLGDEAEILEPSSLRNQIKSILDEVMKKYEIE